MRFARHTWIAAALVLAPSLAGTLAAPSPSSAAQGVPQVLIDQLEARRDDANAALARERAKLATRAKTTTAAKVRATRAAHDHEIASAVVEAFPGAPVPVTDAVDDLDATASATAIAFTSSELQLEDATSEAAAAQGTALDADRRVRALQRAVSTEDDTDTGIGSWRFGSGGPAVSAATLDAYLASKASPIAGSGADLLKTGIKYEIDPRFIVAIAGAESYFGLTLCAPHNAWGWGCPSGPYRFDSWAAGFDTVARGLRENYLDDGLTTVGKIHLRYAPPAATNDPTGLNYAWADNVAGFLIEQGGDPESVAGVRKSAR